MSVYAQEPYKPVYKSVPKEDCEVRGSLFEVEKSSGPKDMGRTSGFR